MKVSTTIFFFLLVLLSTVQTFAADTLTIVHVNDTHSFLAPGGRRDAKLQGSLGGIARAATVIGEIKATEKNVLTLHAGDVFIGDLFFQKYYGVAEFGLMSALGFDAMTLGNHEFDLTPATLETALDTAFAGGQSFALLSANLVIPKDSLTHLKKYVQNNCIRTVNGIKVGIFGLTTPATNILSQPAPAFIDTNIVAIAMANIDELKKQNCDVIICLSHLGLALDEAIAANVEGIDLIVGGHDHYLLEKAVMVTNASGHATPIVQAASFYHAVGEVHLVIDAAKKVSLLDSKVISLTTAVPEAPQIKSIVDGLVADIEQTFGKVYSAAIAEADDDFAEVAEHPTLLQKQDTPIGNLVSDAYREYGHTDIGIQPGGSTAEMLYKGPLVAADAFRVSGYGFNLANGLGYRMSTCTLTGADIMAGLEFGLANIEENDEYMLQCSGMSYQYNPTAAPFQRLLSVKVGDKSIEPTKQYTLCINEFVVAFLQFVNVTPTNVQLHGDTTEFQVLSAYCAAKQSLKPMIDGRISAATSTAVRDELAVQTAHAFLAPNPAIDQSTLTIQLNSPADVRIEIYDTRLHEVRSINFPAVAAGEQHLSIDTTALASGSYFVKCYVNEMPSLQLLKVMR